MKIGVTGATGRLGRLVVEELLDLRPDADVVALVRDPIKATELAKSGAEVRTADYDDRASLDTALSGLDKLLLISSNAMGRRIAQHTNVIDAAKAAGVAHLVYTSAPKASTSDMALAVEHKATEEHLTDSGLAHTVLRNNWYTENYAAVIKLAGESGVLVTSAPVDRVASATRRDYAAGAALVLTGDGHQDKVYELSGDRAWDFSELAETIAGVTRRPCELMPVDQERLVATLTQAGMDGITATYFAVTASNMVGGALADATPELSVLLGRPTTPLEETVEEILSH